MRSHLRLVESHACRLQAFVTTPHSCSTRCCRLEPAHAPQLPLDYTNARARVRSPSSCWSVVDDMRDTGATVTAFWSRTPTRNFWAAREDQGVWDAKNGCTQSHADKTWTRTHADVRMRSRNHERAVRQRFVRRGGHVQPLSP